ncbi:MAG TPA: porin [Gemmatimonadales bacterium]|nr:porin [Gemmatimonadales bacterium]
MRARSIVQVVASTLIPGLVAAGALAAQTPASQSPGQPAPAVTDATTRDSTPKAPAAKAPASPVTVGGVVYAQYGWAFSDTVARTNNFDVTRAYVNVLGKFGGGIGGRVTTDVYRVADGSLSIRLKYAYATWQPEGSPLTFKLGQMHTPWVDFEETLWGYRMQGTIALDRNGYISSSDFGAGVDGTWANDRVNLQLGVYNGEGYSKAPGDKRKDVSGRVSVRLLDTDDMSRVGGVRLTAFGQLGTPTGGGIRNRYIGMLSYHSKLLTLAGEYAVTRDRLDAPPAPATPTATAVGHVFSGFGVVRVPRTPVGVMGRVDVVDPNKDVDGDRQTRVIAGVSYQVSPNLRLLGDVDLLSFQTAPAPASAAALGRNNALAQLELKF